MSQPAESLRQRLLDVEPADPARIETLQKRIREIFETPLTAKSRLWWRASLAAAALFAIWGGVILVLGGQDIYLRIVWAVYTLAQIAFICFVVRMLREGVFRLHYFLRFIAAASPGGAVICALALVVRAANMPSVASLAWAVFGLLCVVVAAAWFLHGRIAQAELANREQLLRLELERARMPGGTRQSG